jgi:hypothetical protein
MILFTIDTTFLQHDGLVESLTPHLRQSTSYTPATGLRWQTRGRDVDFWQRYHHTRLVTKVGRCFVHPAVKQCTHAELGVGHNQTTLPFIRISETDYQVFG